MKTTITNKILTHVFTILAMILFGATIGTAAPGDLDLSFGSGGIVVTTITNAPYYENARAMKVQPDGKIVVCGMIEYDEPISPYFFLARYNPNGTLDASFGASGITLSQSFNGHDIALQPDGKIIILGSWNGFEVRRYNTNGSLDTSFGAGGVVHTPIGLGASSKRVAVQADGKIVVVGYSFPGPGANYYYITVVRYNPDGSLDSSFNGTGKVVTSFGSYSDADAVVLQPDGKIVVVGWAQPGESPHHFALFRYNPDGSLDSGFGAGGKVIHAVSTGYDEIRDVTLQPDGKIVATGSINYSATPTSTAIVRYNINGSIDTSFAQNGIFTTEENFYVGNGIALQSDGKLVAFGYADTPVREFAVVRLYPNGTPDAGFGANGRVTNPIGANNFSAAVAGAVQSDGKILAFGTTYSFLGDDGDIAIIRFLGDSAIQRPAQFDFDGDGKSDISVFRPSDRTWYLNQSTNGFSATQFGLSTDKITPADFDGDGKTDISVYRDGVWYWLKSSDNSFSVCQFGIASDIPVPADFNGDGKTELAVYRNGIWWMLNLTNDQTQVVNFGLPTDKPLPADYDGDGRIDQAVYRGSGEWHLNRSSQGYTVVNFGLATDIPVVGDYDGDGRADQAVYRDGTWYLLQSTQGFTAFAFGVALDIPAPADYDGDGKTDAAVYRDGTWWLRQSRNGISTQQFGLAGDKPTPAAYLP
jgi:uncharacterized delta-60 repeat protein